MDKEGNNKQSLISSIFSFACLAILTVIALFFMFYITVNVIARKNKTRPLVSLFTIVSPSMEPVIKVYDIVFETRVTDESSLKKGDIITFYTDAIDTGGYTVTHRIDDIIDDNGIKRYLTKGDNNQVRDVGSITFKDIVGKVNIIIPKLGYIQAFLSTIYGWILVILIPTIAIITGEIKKLLKVMSIKKQIEDIPKMKEISEYREQEKNKKLRAVLEKADNFSNRK